jgi:hypothetical protein
LHQFGQFWTLLLCYRYHTAFKPEVESERKMYAVCEMGALSVRHAPDLPPGLVNVDVSRVVDADANALTSRGTVIALRQVPADEPVRMEVQVEEDPWNVPDVDVPPEDEPLRLQDAPAHPAPAVQHAPTKVTVVRRDIDMRDTLTTPEDTGVFPEPSQSSTQDFEGAPAPGPTRVKPRGRPRIHPVGLKAVYVCEICEKDGIHKAFQRSNRLRDHIRVKHKGEELICDFCPIKFSDEGARIRHMHSHTKKEALYQCPVEGCDFTTMDHTMARAHELRRHAEDPKGVEKPFMCEICSAAFISIGYVLKHQRATECGQFAKFRCRIKGCLAGNRSMVGLQKHLRLKHKNVNIRKIMRARAEEIYGRPPKDIDDMSEFEGETPRETDDERIVRIALEMTAQEAAEAVQQEVQMQRQTAETLTRMVERQKVPRKQSRPHRIISSTSTRAEVEEQERREEEDKRRKEEEK